MEAFLRRTFGSKTVWAMILGALIPILNRKFGWELSVEELMASMSPILGYILGEKYRDAKREEANGAPKK